MAIWVKPSKQTVFLLVLITLFSTTFLKSHSYDSDSDSDSHSNTVSDLLTLQSQSPSGVIHLNDHLLRRILTSPPRPFSLLLFFDATQLHDKTELRLKHLKSHFSLLAQSFITNNQNTPSQSKLFFAQIEFKESQSTFAQFGVNALPHIRLITPTTKDLKSDSIQMDGGDLSRLSESMADFILTHTKLSVGPIHHPPLISKTQIVIITTAFLIWLPFLVKRVLAGGTLVHDWRVWLSGAVFVYYFSVSGCMFNIIRKMPMFLADQNDPNKMVFFYQGSGMQLGAEGFAIGFLYTIVGLLLAFMTHGLVWVRNLTAQRVVMVVALLVSFWAVKKVVFLDNWKTGYGIHAYLPSSWK